MKYWNDNEIQYIEYEEGGRTLPFKNPASITESNFTRIETEIIPGTEKVRKYVCVQTFDMKEGLCVEMERRIRRGANNGFFIEQFYAPLSELGYNKEPTSAFSNFSRAMLIV